MNTPLREHAADTPFLIPAIPWALEKCEFLEQFKLVIAKLPDQVQSFLYTNLVDPFFTQMRQNAAEPENVPRTHRLILLYQCIRKCKYDQVSNAVCAVSLVTGLNPKIILDHNRLHLPQIKVDIMEAIHKKASRPNPEPAYAFSGRIEVSEKAEYLPSTLLWTLSTNPLNNVDLQKLDGLFEKQKDLITPLSLDEIPGGLSDQQKYYLLNPTIRRNIKSPFFHSLDLSEGFNPAHGLPPVPCFNEFDDQKPPQIRWIADLELPENIHEDYKDCRCVRDDCNHCHILTFSDNKRTMCYRPDGTIDLNELNDCRPLIIECNPRCKCNILHCKNRIVQNRSKVQLMVVRSKTKSGWGVRTMEFVPRGTFVCEYLGKVISDPMMAEIMGREYDDNLESYLFDLDAYGVEDNEMLTVDPSRVGNVSKYINHSCDPNLVQISIGTVESQLFHKIAFFAARDIYPNEELGFHYNYELDKDPKRFIECNCGCYVCRTRLR